MKKSDDPIIDRPLYMERIRPFIDKDIVKVLTGIRRCGKSMMLQLVAKELIAKGVEPDCIIDINFESKAVDYITSVDRTYTHIANLIGRSPNRYYLFFDEIQELPGWEKLVNSIMIDLPVDIYITGSNAKLLSGELATYLGGRYVEIKIYPFSFREVVEAQRLNGSKALDEELFTFFIKTGGMPYLHRYVFEGQATKQYLTDVYNSILLKDIVQRNSVRDTSLLDRFLAFVIMNMGNTFSASSVTKFLKSEGRSMSTETIYNYLTYGQNACFFSLVPREDLIGKKVLSFQEKIYLMDHGFRESLFGSNQRDINQVLENIIYMELLRRGYTITIGRIDETEVDFIGKNGNSILYIQVAYLLASQETVEREFAPLERIRDNYPKFVLSFDNIDMSRNGIVHMNIRKFLLEFNR